MRHGIVSISHVLRWWWWTPNIRSIHSNRRGRRPCKTWSHLWWWWGRHAPKLLHRRWRHARVTWLLWLTLPWLRWRHLHRRIYSMLHRRGPESWHRGWRNGTISKRSGRNRSSNCTIGLWDIWKWRSTCKQCVRPAFLYIGITCSQNSFCNALTVHQFSICLIKQENSLSWLHLYLQINEQFCNFELPARQY